MYLWADHVCVCVQLITTYATNFITKTQLEALLQHMKVGSNWSREANANQCLYMYSSDHFSTHYMYM